MMTKPKKAPAESTAAASRSKRASTQSADQTHKKGEMPEGMKRPGQLADNPNYPEKLTWKQGKLENGTLTPKSGPRARNYVIVSPASFNAALAVEIEDYLKNAYELTKEVWDTICEHDLLPDYRNQSWWRSPTGHSFQEKVHNISPHMYIWMMAARYIEGDSPYYRTHWDTFDSLKTDHTNQYRTWDRMVPLIDLFDTIELREFDRDCFHGNKRAWAADLCRMGDDFPIPTIAELVRTTPDTDSEWNETFVDFPIFHIVKYLNETRKASGYYGNAAMRRLVRQGNWDSLRVPVEAVDLFLSDDVQFDGTDEFPDDDYSGHWYSPEELYWLLVQHFYLAPNLAWDFVSWSTSLPKSGPRRVDLKAVVDIFDYLYLEEEADRADCEIHDFMKANPVQAASFPGMIPVKQSKFTTINRARLDQWREQCWQESTTNAFQAAFPAMGIPAFDILKGPIKTPGKDTTLKQITHLPNVEVTNNMFNLDYFSSDEDGYPLPVTDFVTKPTKFFTHTDPHPQTRAPPTFIPSSEGEPWDFNDDYHNYDELTQWACQKFYKHIERKAEELQEAFGMSEERLAEWANANAIVSTSRAVLPTDRLRANVFEDAANSKDLEPADVGTQRAHAQLAKLEKEKTAAREAVKHKAARKASPAANAAPAKPATKEDTSSKSPPNALSEAMREVAQRMTLRREKTAEEASAKASATKAGTTTAPPPNTAGSFFASPPQPIPDTSSIRQTPQEPQSSAVNTTTTSQAPQQAPEGGQPEPNAAATAAMAPPGALATQQLGRNKGSTTTNTPASQDSKPNKKRRSNAGTPAPVKQITSGGGGGDPDGDDGSDGERGHKKPASEIRGSSKRPKDDTDDDDEEEEEEEEEEDNTPKTPAVSTTPAASNTPAPRDKGKKKVTETTRKEKKADAAPVQAGSSKQGAALPKVSAPTAKQVAPTLVSSSLMKDRESVIKQARDNSDVGQPTCTPRADGEYAPYPYRLWTPDDEGREVTLSFAEGGPNLDDDTPLYDPVSDLNSVARDQDPPFTVHLSCKQIARLLRLVAQGKRSLQYLIAGWPHVFNSKGAIYDHRHPQGEPALYYDGDVVRFQVAHLSRVLMGGGAFAALHDTEVPYLITQGKIPITDKNGVVRHHRWSSTNYIKALTAVSTISNDGGSREVDLLSQMPVKLYDTYIYRPHEHQWAYTLDPARLPFPALTTIHKAAGDNQDQLYLVDASNKINEMIQEYKLELQPPIEKVDYHLNSSFGVSNYFGLSDYTLAQRYITMAKLNIRPTIKAQGPQPNEDFLRDLVISNTRTRAAITAASQADFLSYRNILRRLEAINDEIDALTEERTSIQKQAKAALARARVNIETLNVLQADVAPTLQMLRDSGTDRMLDVARFSKETLPARLDDVRESWMNHFASIAEDDGLPNYFHANLNEQGVDQLHILTTGQQEQDDKSSDISEVESLSSDDEDLKAYTMTGALPLPEVQSAIEEPSAEAQNATERHVEPPTEDTSAAPATLANRGPVGTHNASPTPSQHANDTTTHPDELDATLREHPGQPRDPVAEPNDRLRISPSEVSEDEE
jgi:hypothetical protein